MVVDRISANHECSDRLGLGVTEVVGGEGLDAAGAAGGLGFEAKAVVEQYAGTGGAAGDDFGLVHVHGRRVTLESRGFARPGGATWLARSWIDDAEGVGGFIEADTEDRARIVTDEQVNCVEQTPPLGVAPDQTVGKTLAGLHGGFGRNELRCAETEVVIDDSYSGSVVPEDRVHGRTEFHGERFVRFTLAIAHHCDNDVVWIVLERDRIGRDGYGPCAVRVGAIEKVIAKLKVRGVNPGGPV